MKIGDEIIQKRGNATGKIIGILSGGYEVRFTVSKNITYENDETIELRYPEDAD